MSSWKRWLRYAKAKIDATVRSGERELDRREAELEAEQAEKPWLASGRDTPSYDEVKARIEHESGAAGAKAPQPSGEPAFDLAEQERAAAERLAGIRESLGLGDKVDDDPKPPPKR